MTWQVIDPRNDRVADEYETEAEAREHADDYARGAAILRDMGSPIPASLIVREAS